MHEMGRADGRGSEGIGDGNRDEVMGDGRDDERGEGALRACALDASLRAYSKERR